MAVDLDAERAHLLARDAKWAAAASDGSDIEEVLSYWTDDALVIPRVPGAVRQASDPGLRSRTMERLHT
jgi:ketosteroid isomerase-like protein